MQLITSRLIVRPVKGSDLARLFAIYGDPATNQFNPNGPMSDISQATLMLEGWLHQWRVNGFGQWAIATRECPERIIGFGGVAMMNYLKVERANLGYRFEVSAWGQGYATELGVAALDWGLNQLELPAIYGLVRPNHSVSIRVLEKIGMQRIDVLDDVAGQAPSYVYVAQ